MRRRGPRATLNPCLEDDMLMTLVCRSAHGTHARAGRRRRRRGRHTLVAAIVVGAALAAAAGAQTTEWTNAGVGNWFIGGNWHAGVPQPGSIAQIRNDGLALLNSPGATAAFLNLGQSGRGLVDVSGAGRLTVGSQLDVHNGTFRVIGGAAVVVQ